MPYYERWLARFPSVGVLAEAPTRDVLSLWSGLGYNRRALALQRAAEVVAADGWPADLTTLPGVGPYTAAAVGSFAWDRQEAAVDTNVRRVLERRDGVAADAARAVGAGDVAAAVGTGGDVQPGDDGARRDRLPPAGAACAARVRSLPAVAARCPLFLGAGPAVRFEDTDRWARGRLLAALLAGEAPPVQGERLERALAGLERDGLIVRESDGSFRLP